MLSEYRKYLLRIRNNLIQCGVEFPVSKVSSYREIFELGCELDEILWYYSILAVSGSEEALNGFFLPLNGYYKERVRSLTYKEFSDFIKDYDKISLSGRLKAKKAVERLKSELETSSKRYGDVVQLSRIGEGVGEANGEVEDADNQEIISGRFIEDEDVSEDVVSSGRFVDDSEESNTSAEDSSEDSSAELESTVSSGRFIDEEPDVGDSETGRVVDEEPSESEEQSGTFSDHGRYVDMEEESSSVEDVEDDWDIVEEDEAPYSEEDDEDWDIIEEDEAPHSVDVDSEDDEDWDIVEEGSESQSVDSVDDDDEDWDIVEEDEVSQSSNEDEDDDDWDIVEEDEAPQPVDDDDEDWDIIEEDEAPQYADDDDEDWDFVEEDEEPHPVDVEDKPVVKNTSGSPSQQNIKQERDLSDTLQDFTNGFLTSIKRAAVKGIKKLEK